MYNIRLLFTEQITPVVESEIIRLIDPTNDLYFGVAKKSVDLFLNDINLNKQHKYIYCSNKKMSLNLMNKNIEIVWIPIRGLQEILSIINNYSSSYFGLLRNDSGHFEDYTAKFSVLEHYMHNDNEFRMLSITFWCLDKKNNFLHAINKFSIYFNDLLEESF